MSFKSYGGVPRGGGKIEKKSLIRLISLLSSSALFMVGGENHHGLPADKPWKRQGNKKGFILMGEGDHA